MPKKIKRPIGTLYVTGTKKTFIDKVLDAIAIGGWVFIVLGAIGLFLG
ncbi:MAG: hypothetical protein AAFR98_12865 [Pseudomonadota bacterium]